MSDIFYVYEHWRPDLGVCFYVGKGNGDRAFRIKRKRNKFYLRIVKKLEKLGLSVEVKIISADLSESDALAFEVQRIAYWRDQGRQLANLTDGGEGVSGLKHSAETKRKLSDISKRITKEVMADPEVRAKISKTVTEQMADPQRRLHLSKKITEVMADVEMRKRISGKMTAVMADPDVRKSRSESMKIIMADPERRAVQSTTMSEISNRPENREARRKSTAESWKDPQIAKSRSDGIKKAIADDSEAIPRRSEAMRLRMADPVYREMMAAINRARHKAAREEKLLASQG